MNISMEQEGRRCTVATSHQKSAEEFKLCVLELKTQTLSQRYKFIISHCNASEDNSNKLHCVFEANSIQQDKIANTYPE